MGRDQPRITTQTLKVLGALMASPECEISGAEIGAQTQLASGTLYPILIRLEEAGWAESHWESGNPQELGRPRRRYYQVTPLGKHKAKTAFREMSSAIGGLAWQ